MSMTIDPAALVLSAAVSAAAGLVGCFVVMRRMTLAADAISHVALPGIGVAFALHVHPLMGAVAMLLFGAVAIWALERRSGLATETIIGVVFSTALAAGSLMSSGDELIEALFGGAGTLSRLETSFGLAAAVAIVYFILRQRNSLVLTLVSSEIARSAGVNVERLNLLFLETFALTIALGLRFLGVLLMGSLIIIPAATAKRMAHSLRGMMLFSVAVAVGSSTLGTIFASAVDRPPGPVIVCVAAGFFALSFAQPKRVASAH